MLCLFQHEQEISGVNYERLKGQIEMKTVLQLSRVCSWPCHYSSKRPYIISFGSHDEVHTNNTQSSSSQSQHPMLLVLMMRCALLVKLWFINAIWTLLDTNRHHRLQLHLVLTSVSVDLVTADNWEIWLFIPGIYTPRIKRYNGCHWGSQRIPILFRY